MSQDASSLRGKTCLITGATMGIGKETALALARLNAAVVLTARDLGRGEATVAEIREKSGNQAVTVLHVDLSSQASIRELVDEFRRRHQQLHILINNAGAINMERRLTVDGLELTFATNHLAYFLLTSLLLDVIKASAPARIVNVASEAHQRGTIDFDDLQGEKGYGAWRAYGQSKLANILFTYELARRLAGTGVAANCLHPGVVASGFGRNERSWLNLGERLAAPFMLSPEKGARTTIYLASSPAVEGVTGKYFKKCQEARSSKISYDPEVARRLWEVSAKLTGLA